MFGLLVGLGAVSWMSSGDGWGMSSVSGTVWDDWPTFVVVRGLRRDTANIRKLINIEIQI